MDAEQAKQIEAMKQAIRAGDEKWVRELLDSGCSPDLDVNPGPYPCPALEMAARELHFDICKLLLERGANVHGDAKGWNIPLRTAAGQYKPLAQRMAVCELLLQHGANPNDLGSGHCETAMHHAIKKQPGDDVTPLIRLMMRYGGDLGYVPPNPHQGYLTPFQHEVNIGDLANMQFMLEECDQNPFQKTVAGRSLLQICCKYENQERKEMIREAQKMWRAKQTVRSVTEAVNETESPAAPSPATRKSPGQSAL